MVPGYELHLQCYSFTLALMNWFDGQWDSPGFCLLAVCKIYQDKLRNNICLPLHSLAITSRIPRWGDLVQVVGLAEKCTIIPQTCCNWRTGLGCEARGDRHVVKVFEHSCIILYR